ncbi:MAG TPA: hypothetical protein VMV23_05465 [Candidatus Nanopelagicaceae bacterium]|nr:hypothetical protein [Candidatus Nanopelagicaceae bacterium]
MKMSDLGVGAGVPEQAQDVTVGLRLRKDVAERLASWMKDTGRRTVSRACRELVDERLREIGY